MAEERREERSREDRGVFGNLPSSRPGVRSPRRDAGSGRAPRRGKAEPRGGGRPRAAAQPPRARRAPPPKQEPPIAERQPEEQEAPQGGGVEDLAWAGVAVAAEAATLGVRLLSRAMDAVRKPADPR